MEVGYWTPSLEQWFVERRKLILTGKEQPKNASEWKSFLRCRKTDTATILAAARGLAANSLPAAQ